MRVLLDEHLDRRLRMPFDPEHRVLTVGDMGWNGTKDGPLLARAQADFDVLVTMDRSLIHQQNVQALSISSSCCGQ